MPSAMQIRQMPCHVPVINDDRRVSEGISRENRPIKSGETPKLGESIPRGNFRDVCSRRIRLGSAVCIRFSRRSRIYWPGLMPMRKVRRRSMHAIFRCRRTPNWYVPRALCRICIARATFFVQIRNCDVT
jgi:hypothetical protein